jgi:hypothetical protein
LFHLIRQHDRRGLSQQSGRETKRKEAHMYINRRIERFLIQYNYPATKFGRMVAHDPRLVPDMRRGRELGAAMIVRAEAFMDQYAHETAARMETAA